MRQSLSRWGWRMLHVLKVLGAVTVLAAIILAVSPAARHAVQGKLLEWLAARALREAQAESDGHFASRLVARDLSEVSPGQAAVARHLGQTYAVAPEPIAALVHEAHRVGPSLGIAPHLLLAVAAVESNFHPYIQSPAGAQGLMQIMTRIHDKRLQAEGGSIVVFDAIINLRVGARILHDCIRIMGGSTEAGLNFYLGGGATESETGQAYVRKVRDIQQTLDRIDPPAANKP